MHTCAANIGLNDLNLHMRSGSTWGRCMHGFGNDLSLAPQGEGQRRLERPKRFEPAHAQLALACGRGGVMWLWRKIVFTQKRSQHSSPNVVWHWLSRLVLEVRALAPNSSSWAHKVTPFTKLFLVNNHFTKNKRCDTPYYDFTSWAQILHTPNSADLALTNIYIYNYSQYGTN